MRQVHLGLSLLVLSLVLLRPAFATSTIQEIVQQNGGSVCLVATLDMNNNFLALGSGFVCADGKVTTNFHVIEGCDKVLVRFPDHSVLSIDNVSNIDLDNDLVVLRVAGLTKPALPLVNSAPVIVGEHVTVISNPEGLANTVSDGIVSALRTLDDGRILIQVTAPISHGSSGAPVFNDRGDVIGIARSSVVEGQNLNFAVPVDYLRQILAQDRKFSLANLPKRVAAVIPPASATGSMEGSWTAIFTDSRFSGSLNFILTQNSSGDVVGTYSASTGGGGTLVGKLRDGVFEFELTQSTTACPGIFKGKSGPLGNVISGTYYGNDCLGYHENGKFSLTRGQSAAMNPPPQPVSPPATTPPPPVQFTHGDVSELAGIRKVYVFTGNDVILRSKIIEQLQKTDLVGLTENVAEADVVLVFGASKQFLGNYSGAWVDAYGNAHSYTVPRSMIESQGFACKMIPPSTIRVLWTFTDTQRSRFERSPWSNFVRNFLKLIK